jgi:serine phosphatase RsbU (regulator of sigma subunit)
VYLVDVSGHGVGSAMHSVAVMNLLRQRALPNVDFEHPGEVLSSLNTRFPMDEHNGMYFTIWYGVYRTDSRRLTYGSAGHHPAYLVPPDRGTANPLGMPALMIGVMPQTYEVQETTVPPGSRLYLFSDGVFEIVPTAQQRWALSDFLPFLTQPMLPATSEADRLHGIVSQAAGPGPLEDDFSLVVVAFE